MTAQLSPELHGFSVIEFPLPESQAPARPDVTEKMGSLALLDDYRPASETADAHTRRIEEIVAAAMAADVIARNRDRYRAGVGNDFDPTDVHMTFAPVTNTDGQRRSSYLDLQVTSPTLGQDIAPVHDDLAAHDAHLIGHY